MGTVSEFSYPSCTLNSRLGASGTDMALKTVTCRETHRSHIEDAAGDLFKIAPVRFASGTKAFSSYKKRLTPGWQSGTYFIGMDLPNGKKPAPPIIPTLQQARADL